MQVAKKKAAPPSKRPKVNLGALGGDKDYVTKRCEDLLDTFNVILKSLIARETTLRTGEKYVEWKPLKLIDAYDGQGCTDCKTFIKVPLSEYEGILVAEHELSHILFT